MQGRQQNNSKIITAIFLIIAPLVFFACGVDLNNELVEKAKAGDSAAIERLLAEGADVNAIDNKHGSTALMWAAHNGHSETVKILIRNGATIDQKRTKGETALWFSAQKGQLEPLKVLVNNGADINVVGRDGETSLVVARKNGHSAVVKYLLKCGASE